MNLLPLDPDQLLSTTRAVRKRIDFDRPVEREVIEECMAMALQAPTASNSQPWQFVIVTDADTKLAIAELYRKSYAAYAGPMPDAEALATPQGRMRMSSQYLADRFHEVPAFVIPCVFGRLDELPGDSQSAMYGSIVQAGWSFCLAARARSMGTCWTTLHLTYEREVAEILGIPFAEVTQTSLITLGYTLGTEFKAAARGDLSEVVRWDHW